MGYQTIGNILFIGFSLAFIIPRIIMYLYLVLIPGYTFLREYASELLVPIWGLLMAVFFLNLYWAMLILRMVHEFLTKGKLEKDIRDLPEKKIKKQISQTRKRYKKRT
ncbi:hypothetical protein NEOKW01_0909 [Nematocida sp. AWRm80]|nr:hypothetical protein NEOKW01_0909 [Nematocida sp. AWRm80]